ncbi:hypothetical protein UA08_01380 [Talaromyces atroroseus]|uniref:Checkpoint protein n=1 Tax=Talaromyces atroroseus TaxID=1441469 RepID=A0A1Q5QA42_TALAT|nr:hypothetical protein UA08_01380 [Talaromyces atroroseus]OKL62639.1 hypothetical protein UA08_01380 [Talaromyces atroroseus]
MRFRTQLSSVSTFANQGTQVWAALPTEAIFDESYTLEAAAGVVNLEVPIGALSRALRSANGATSAQLRLTKKGNIPLLALTIISSSLVPGNVPLGVDADNELARPNQGYREEMNQSAARERETVITQEIPVKVLHQSVVDGLHEPHCRDPDVHIILPSLAQLKAISDRFTKLATSSSKSSGGPWTSAAFGPKLELSANMHGSLKIGIATDSLRISSVWTGLVNPPLDPNQMPDTDMDQLPSERMRQLGAEANGDDEAGWAKVRIDGKDWGRVLSVGRLSPKVVACFIHESALILYVYLRGGFSGEESCLTYYINSYST